MHLTSIIIIRKKVVNIHFNISSVLQVYDSKCSVQPYLSRYWLRQHICFYHRPYSSACVLVVTRAGGNVTGGSAWVMVIRLWDVPTYADAGGILQDYVRDGKTAGVLGTNLV